jgi:glutaminase
VKRLNLLGYNLDQGDYDGRTALHLACSNGHFKIVEYLIDAGLKNINPKDRYNNTPMDDAKRGNYT